MSGVKTNNCLGFLRLKCVKVGSRLGMTKSKLWLRDGGCLIFNIRSLLLALELPVSLTTVSDVPADAAESSSTQPARWDESIEVVG